MKKRISSKMWASSRWLIPGLTVLQLAALPPLAVAGGGGGGYVSYSAERERLQREQAVFQAREAYWQGVALRKEGQLEEAGTYFRTALDLMPNAEKTRAERGAIGKAFGDVCVELAKTRAADGKLTDARRYVDVSLEYAPDHEASLVLKERLNDPDWYAPGDTPAHRAKVESVDQNLHAGKANLDLGRIDQAEENYFEVLRDDKYNGAARDGLTEVETARSEYLGASYDRTRSELLDDVASKWEMQVPSKSSLRSGVDGADTLAPGGDTKAAIDRKLKTLVIPEIALDSVTVQTAIDYLQLRSRDLDPEGTGVTFVTDTQAISAVDAGALTRPFTIILKNVPLKVVLDYICDLTGLRPNVEAYAVKIVPSGDTASEQIINKSYKVPPSFERLGADDATGGGGGGAADDPFATGGGASGPAFGARAAAADILKSRGIPWPTGANAFYNASSSSLTVSNTRSNMELVDAFVDSIQETVVKQAEIGVKFVEIQQNNLEELGFDWLLGGFGINGDRLIGGGGTRGNSRGVYNESQFPFFTQTTDANGNPVIAATGVNPVTGGLRSGNQAIVGNAIDSLIRDLPRGQAEQLTPAPGIMSLAGIFTDPQFQVVLRGLSQKKGADLVTAPKVVTRSASRAKIEVIRELIYPVEFDPPELPQRVGSTDTGFFPVTPSHPTTFEMRPTGVTLEVDPQIGPDSYQVDLSLRPEIVEFEGFVNYGSPITAAGTDAVGNPTRLLITDNRIDLPIFATRRANTNVTVFDGSTVALGGLIREDVQHVTDKVPVVGDLPFVGRLFRSESEQHLRRNLVIFVSVKLVDPSGAAFRKIREDGVTGLE